MRRMGGEIGVISTGIYDVCMDDNGSSRVGKAAYNQRMSYDDTAHVANRLTESGEILGDPDENSNNLGTASARS